MCCFGGKYSASLHASRWASGKSVFCSLCIILLFAIQVYFVIWGSYKSLSMFYPVDSLKRGGRFYLCWLADSWPLRFATITQRQLWSQDIRQICEELIEVVSKESGRPGERFSLRLSSQLLCGLVRLYMRKVTILCNQLCMINAIVFKHSNKKFNESYNAACTEVHPRTRTAPRPAHSVREHDDINPRELELMIQNSGNVVANIQDITLREAAIPDFQLPPNDNFGEQNPEQALQGICDRTVETMLVGRPAQLTTSGLAVDMSHDKTRDKSLLVPEIQMQMDITGQDMTFRKSDAGAIPVSELDKEIPENPEISEIPIPELSVPQEKQAEVVEEIPDVRTEQPIQAAEDRQTATRASDIIILEELEEGEPHAKRRRNRGLIIDKNIKINSQVLRTRTANPRIDLRCEDSSDDIIEIRTPCEVYMQRPSKGIIATKLARMFHRNLGYIYRHERSDTEMDMAHVGGHARTLTVLQRIEEEEEAILEAQNQAQGIPEYSVINDQVILPELNIEAYVPDRRITRKRISENFNTPSPPKIRRSSGFTSFRNEQKKQKEVQIETEQIPVVAEPEKEFVIPAINLEEDDKENIAANMQIPTNPTKDLEKRVTSLLQQAGLADIQADIQPFDNNNTLNKDGQRKTTASEGSETPLGSLDRTKVSLGDSEKTTDSMRFIKDEWGTQGTMMKIIMLIKRKETVTVKNLVDRGPIIPGHKAMVAARCFNSILKLCQHGYVKIIKRPGTSELQDIKLGLKFY